MCQIRQLKYVITVSFDKYFYTNYNSSTFLEKNMSDKMIYIIITIINLYLNVSVTSIAD